MNNLLQKWLQKLKIENVNELNPEEKETFDRWNLVLSEKEITVEGIKEFCERQLRIIEEQLKNVDNISQKNERLIIYFNIYKALLDLIKSPQAERSSLERNLEQLLKQ